MVKATKYMPESVYEELSSEERKEVEQYLSKRKGKNVSMPLEQMLSSNKGLHYIVMQDPIKYSMLSLPSIEEDELLSLISYDRTRLDEFHKLFGNGDFEGSMKRQFFNCVMAALHSPNLTKSGALYLLKELEEAHRDECTPEEFAEVVEYQLSDKWNPQEFSSAVCSALIELFENADMKKIAGNYKRRRRSAEKREQG